MKVRPMFLLLAAMGLIPIALSYGLMPKQSLNYLFDISVTNTNNIHIYRAVMGLYLAMVLFWIIGAIKVQVRQAALYSLVIFMLGLAGGRILSLIIDGIPHLLLLIYLMLELGFGISGIILLQKLD